MADCERYFHDSAGLVPALDAVVRVDGAQVSAARTHAQGAVPQVRRHGHSLAPRGVVAVQLALRGHPADAVVAHAHGSDLAVELLLELAAARNAPAGQTVGRVDAAAVVVVRRDLFGSACRAQGLRHFQEFEAFLGLSPASRSVVAGDGTDLIEPGADVDSILR